MNNANNFVVTGSAAESEPKSLKFGRLRSTGYRGLKKVGIPILPKSPLYVKNETFDYSVVLLHFSGERGGGGCCGAGTSSKISEVVTLVLTPQWLRQFSLVTGNARKWISAPQPVALPRIFEGGG